MPKKYDSEKKLPPLSDHRVSLKRAARLTRNYRESIPAADKTGFFHKQAVTDLLRQPGVAGMRYYHGLDDKGGYHLVLVGVDQDGRDIVESKGGRPSKAAKGLVAAAPTVATTAAVAGGSAVILDTHFPCPPYCPPKGPLNF